MEAVLLDLKVFQPVVPRKASQRGATHSRSPGERPRPVQSSLRARSLRGLRHSEPLCTWCASHGARRRWHALGHGQAAQPGRAEYRGAWFESQGAGTNGRPAAGRRRPLGASASPAGTPRSGPPAGSHRRQPSVCSRLSRGTLALAANLLVDSAAGGAAHAARRLLACRGTSLCGSRAIRSTRTWARCSSPSTPSACSVSTPRTFWRSAHPAPPPRAAALAGVAARPAPWPTRWTPLSLPALRPRRQLKLQLRHGAAPAHPAHSAPPGTTSAAAPASSRTRTRSQTTRTAT